MSDDILRELARPFPPGLVKTVQKGHGEEKYVAWYDVVQRLISIVGQFDWRIEKVIYTDDDAGGRPTRVEVVGKLTAFGTVVSGIGDDEGKTTRDGKWIPPSAKNAESDAIKRASSKLGLGLHLWTGGSYWLDKQLDKDEGVAPSTAGGKALATDVAPDQSALPEGKAD